MITNRLSTAAVEDTTKETIFVTIAMAISSNQAASIEQSLTINKMMISEETAVAIATYVDTLTKSFDQ